MKASVTPDAVALADERIEWTWAEVDRRLDLVANALQALEVGASGRVAVFAENSAETALVYLGGVIGGVSTVPVSFHLTAAEVAYILEDSDARALLVGPENVEVGIEAARKAGVDTVIGWRCDGLAPGDGVVPFERWVDEAEDTEPSDQLPLRPHLHYTSGTTGRPKGTETPPAMLPGGATVGEHVANLGANPMFQLGGASLVVGPMYHTGPLSSLRGLFGGVAQVVLGRFDPEETLAAVERHRVTTSIMVPTHFQRLLALPEGVRGRYDVSSLVLVGHTGAACPVEVKRAMIDWWGPVLFEAYGGTEAGTTNAITSEEWLAKPGSVGRTLPAFELLVVGEDETRLGPNEVGQLYFRDSTGRGIVYHNDAEKTAAAHLEPGVFTLGEVGYVDEDGYVFITDRTSDMIVSGGVNVYPAEAEAVLIRHPDVADVACIGIPHDDLGEQLHALVVPTHAGAPPDEKALIAFCRGSIAHFKVPRSVQIVADLGRNAMGKLNKRALRAPYWPTDRTIG